MTTDVYPRENCIAPAIVLIAWTTDTKNGCVIAPDCVPIVALCSYSLFYIQRHTALSNNSLDFRIIRFIGHTQHTFTRKRKQPTLYRYSQHA